MPVPRRFQSAAPTQLRSRETLERFAEALEALLQSRTFEEISVREIARRAERPVGSFYARFRSKEAVLPLLYQRYHDRLEAIHRSGLERTAWNQLDFARTCSALAIFALRCYDERRGLLRAVALFARTRPEALPADIVAHRRRIHDGLAALLLRHRAHIAHSDAEAAVRFALFMAFSVAREKILFGEAPHARTTPMSREDLGREIARAIHSYLTCEAPR